MMILKITSAPLILYFASAKAPRLQTITDAATDDAEVNTLLNTYLLKGTTAVFTAVSRSLKLLIVGFRTRKRGGKRKSSSYGLKAVDTRYRRGREVNRTNPNIAR